MRLSATTLHVGLHSYWDALRRGRAMPARGDLRPEELRTLLPYLSLVETEGDSFRYRLVGTAVVEALGRDMTGTIVGSHVRPAAYANEICRAYQLVVDSRAPIFTVGEYLAPSKAVHAVCRLLLPLSADGETVNMIVLLRASQFSDQPAASVDWMDLPGHQYDAVPVAGGDDVAALCRRWEDGLAAAAPARQRG